MPARDAIKSVVINGLRYPLAAPVERSMLAIFVRKFTIGDAQYDSDDYQSALIYSNFSGGLGIEDSDEGADTSRFWFAVMDTRSPRMLALPPLVTATQPSGVTGTTVRPLGVIGTQFYCCFNDVAYGWNDSTGDWHTTANDLDFVPVNKPVKFDANTWVPQGANGIRSVTETNASNGTLTEANITANPMAAALSIWRNNLYALATNGALYVLTQGSTSWTQVADSGGVNAILHTGETPKNLVTYFDRSGNPTLWAITDRSAYMWYDSLRTWVRSNIQFPPHPDFGRSATVWRTGEDLWITAASDIVRQTTGNAIVPAASGLSRDQGVPQEYRGTIYDLEPEISNLYALAGAAGSTAPYAYSSKFGADGSGDGQFNTPKQVALDSSGNIYVADFGNDRVQKFNSAGVHQSNIITSVDEVTGLCVDSSGNIYLTFKNGASDYRARKYNSAGTLQWTSSSGTTTATGHIATNGTNVWFTVPASITRTLGYYDCSTGSQTLYPNNYGTSDGQFTTPYGIAYSSTTGTLFVVDQGNDRVQELTTSNTFVRKWGSSGSGNGQFQTATGVAANPTNGNVVVADSGRDDLQEFTSSGAFVRIIGGAGTGNGQFAAPDGIAIEADGDIQVSDTQSGDDRIQKFAYTAFATTAYPTLFAWPGTGWHCLWAGTDNTDIPTWAMVSAPSTHYRLWWGMDDGYARYITLFRGFENVNQARQAGSAYFAASGFLLTSKFDAGMLGFPKLASHVVVIPVLGTITSTETILIEFSIDDGGWESLGTVNSTTLGTAKEVRFSFGSTGRAFNTIRFRLTGARGSTTTLSSMMRSLTLLFNKIPQEATSLVFTIAESGGDKGTFGRSGHAMRNELDALCFGNAFIDLSYNGQTWSHCRIASVTGADNIADTGARMVVSAIQLPTGA